MPKVSVIIPVYGVEKYIERCAVSLFEQTLDDIEFIFVDDCTPDRSIEILNSVIEKYRFRFAKDNKLVRVERMGTNSGLCEVRKTGVRLCSGDYIIHCDSDDWVEPDMYRLMYEKATKENADVVVCDYHKSDGHKYTEYRKTLIDRDWSSYMNDMLHMKVSWAVWNKLFKREFYESVGSFPSFSMGEDLVLTMQLMANVKSISYIEQPLYNYFYNPDSITHTTNESKIFNNYTQLKANVETILKFWHSQPHKKNKHIQKGLNYICYNTKIILTPLLINQKYWSIYKKTYPCVEKRIMIDSDVPIKLRFRAFLEYIGLYRVILLVKNIIK